VLVSVAVISLLSWVVRGPAFVDQMTITNPTAFDVDVDVAGTDRRRLNLAYVDSGGSVVVRDVIDQGDTWIFRFSYGGTHAGSLRVDRARLARDGWRVEIPARVEMRLDAAGYPPPPSS
jgi:hypothetical protein